MLTNTLLLIHIAAGFCSLVAGIIATLSKVLNISHAWHIYSGRIFVLGMIIIFFTAIPLAFFKVNVFLSLIAIFSAYLALSGWLYAKNRSGRVRKIDWLLASSMFLISFIMITYGFTVYVLAHDNSITLLVFGLIGLGLSSHDIKILRSGGITGVQRIARHLTMMLAGLIAATTAFTVTNFTFTPMFVLWLLPTFIITPMIIVWNRKLKTGQKVKGM